MRSYLSTEDIVKLEHWVNESTKSTKNIIHFVSDHDGVAQYIIEDISNIQSYLYTITQYLDLIRTKKLRSWINKKQFIKQHNSPPNTSHDPTKSRTTRRSNVNSSTHHDLMIIGSNKSMCPWNPKDLTIQRLLRVYHDTNRIVAMTLCCNK